MDCDYCAVGPCCMDYSAHTLVVYDYSDDIVYPLLGAYGCHHVVDIYGLYHEFDSLDLLYYGRYIPSNEYLRLHNAYGSIAHR